MTTRDEYGRYLPGHALAGPGRPKRITEVQYLEATASKVSLEKWGEIVDKAIDDAIKGDKDARRWLSDYLVGKPPSFGELRGGDAALLSQLLEKFKRLGKSPGELFEAMLREFATLEEAEAELDDYERE